MINLIFIWIIFRLQAVLLLLVVVLYHMYRSTSHLQLPVHLLQQHLHRGFRGGEAQRFMQRAIRRLGLARRFPFAENRVEAAGIEQAVGRAIPHLEEVLAERLNVLRARRGAKSA